MAKKTKSKEKSEATPVENQSDVSLLSKLFAPAKVLLRLHFKLAYKEFKRDSLRFFSGVALIFVSLFLLLTLLSS